jgi:hypothetical protein
MMADPILGLAARFIHDHTAKVISHLTNAREAMNEASTLERAKPGLAEKRLFDGEMMSSGRANLIESARLRNKASFEISCAIDNLNAITK